MWQTSPASEFRGGDIVLVGFDNLAKRIGERGEHPVATGGRTSVSLMAGKQKGRVKRLAPR